MSLYDPDFGHSGKWIMVRILYILTHAEFPEGVPDGYVVMSIEKTHWGDI